MPVILHIETTSINCSTALSAEGMILSHHENFEGRSQAALLSGFIKQEIDFCKSKEIKPEAIAVSLGPGSYTGLRIGLSEAKGLAYSLGLPLIGINTLELLVSKVMFSSMELPEDSIFVPMVDARRMEVYTGAYDFALTPLITPGALILDENSYSDLMSTGRPVFFFGDGSAKAMEVIKRPNAFFIEGISPLAVDMLALAERDYMNRKFIDVAYSTPVYLKDFVTTKPKASKNTGD